MVSIVSSDKQAGIFVFKNIEEMAGALFDLLIEEFKRANSEEKSYHLALSGGRTPVKIFEILSRLPFPKMNWKFLHVYWGDERCVPPDNPESNYGNFWNAILKYIDIPEENIHRIHGEDDPYTESKRYSGILRKFIPSFNGFPCFDLVLLGIGEDGHTASIFPDSMHLLNTNEFCYVAVNPNTHQKRITLSLRVLNNSKTVLFLATGSSKTEILTKLIKKKKGYENLPAANVKPENGNLKWFLDAEAGKKIKNRFYFF